MTDLQTGERTAIGADEHAHMHEDGTWHTHSHDDDHAHDHSHEHDHEPEHEHGHDHGHEHHHAHGHDHDHGHHHIHEPAPTTVVELNARILARNDSAAERNRAWFRGREILALNLMSAPGAGKTTLLERTIADLKGQPLFVLEGDQATDNDGERVKAAGAAAVQINTGSGCHLDADMVARGLGALRPTAGALLFIENVGNLVCPALFDLGEHKRVAILSVTEGDDKPLKYPDMFRAAHLMLLNKIDLAPHVDFDIGRATANARRINPDLQVLSVSARTGEGMADWEAWIARAHEDVRAGVFA
jgi:hydrogenase nickel incorporation protein HypB